MPGPLPDVPKVELEVVGDRSSEAEGFLTLKRFDLVLRTPDRPKSTPFRYDLIERRALDAAVMAAHYLHEGERYVYLRSAVRPPVALRADRHEKVASSSLWELPAGLIEPGESPSATAAREIEEELGFALPETALQPLGHWTYPAPGFVGEIHYFFHASVDASARKEPGGDGSPLEEAAVIVSIPLKDALAACRDGTIRDAKTELALRRLLELLG